MTSAFCPLPSALRKLIVTADDVGLDRGMTTGDLWTTSQDNGFMVVKLDANARATSGSGCASADGSLGGMLVLAVMEILRRRRARASRS